MAIRAKKTIWIWLGLTGWIINSHSYNMWEESVSVWETKMKCVTSHPHTSNQAPVVFSCHCNCILVVMVSRTATSGWPWGVLFALEPTLLQPARRWHRLCGAQPGFVAREQADWVWFPGHSCPSVGPLSCPQMLVPAGGDYWWHVAAWNNTEAAVRG